jgi:formate dehydrogenase major subunit/formate dehydrogenase alpha subunit
MTNSIADLSESDCYLITGTNTTENHPVIATFIKRAIVQRGAKLILVDPRDIDLAKFATIWFRQKPGTDIAWINGLIHVIINEGLADEKFIAERTENFDALKKTVSKYTPEHVESITGIPKDELAKAARMYANADTAAILYAMGITQHITGTDNVKSIANLAMVTGNIGRPGTGVNPLRGQNNVQGACDMACLPGNLPGYRKVGDEEHRKPFEDAWGVKLPSKPGFTIPDMVDAAAEGSLKALFVMGENPMMSDPDIGHVEKALKNLDFLVVQDIFLNETGQLAHVVLPTAAWAEKDGSYTNTERRVQRMRKAVGAPGKAIPDWEVITMLARKLGANWHYSKVKEIMDEINVTTASYKGITYDRIEDVGIQWPCPSTNHPGTPILHKDAFARGEGLFSAIEHTPPAEEPDDEYPFILTTGRILYQYHTATMSRRSKGLVSRTPDVFVEINTKDAKDLRISQGDKLGITSRRGSIEVFADISEKCDKGVVFIPFHYSEAAVNHLTNSALDPVAKIPEYKVCAVKINKVV